MKILIKDSYRARKMIRIHREDLLNSSYGQSYGHLKAAHVTSVLDTPLIRLRPPYVLRFAPPSGQKGGASRHVEAVWSNMRYDP